MAVYSSPWVFIDLETTGLRTDTDKIIEFGLVRRDDPDVRVIWEQTVNPSRSLDPSISRITGLDDSILSASPLLSDVSEKARELTGDAVLVAHNAAFDVSFLERELQISVQRSMVVDTLELAKILYPSLRSYSLRNLSRTLQLPALPSHRAKDDALVLEQVFICLAAKACRLSQTVLRRIAMALGDQDNGIAGFFTGLLIGRIPEWLSREIDAAPSSAAEFNIPGYAIAAPYGKESAKEQETLFVEDQELPFGNWMTEESAGEGTSSAMRKEEQEEQALALSFWQNHKMLSLFGKDGALAQKMGNYQHREQQVEMTEAVLKAFEQSRWLMIEAPTGVGKSLAYLLPAVCWAKAFHQRVVIATHTIALQEQLFTKEVSLLKELLPFSFQSVMLKGRGNYLCLNRWRQVMEQGTDLIWGERVLLARIAVWQSEDGRGDMDAIALFGIEREWFSQMASSRETCQGSQCPYYKQCYYQKARIGAGTSQLIIINHALLLSGSRLGDKVLPKYSYLIIDEAHHLEEEGTKQYTDAFSLMEYERKLQQLHRRRDVFGRPGFLQYLKDYRRQGLASLEEMNPFLDTMEKQIKDVMKRVNILQAYLPNSPLPETFRIKPGSHRGKSLEDFLVNLENLLLTAGDLQNTIEQIRVMMQGEEGDIFEETWRNRQLMLFDEAISDTALLEAFLHGVKGTDTQKDNAADERVYWVVRDNRQKSVSLCLTPLHMSECFKRYLFEGKDSIIFTSATLSVSEGFAYCRQQLGIDQDILDTKVLSSPFDHERQVLLLTDKDLPDPSRTSETAYNLALADSLKILLGACGGGSMVLFTSHKQLKAMYEALHQPLATIGLELFADGQNGNRNTLLDELRTNENAVVFGANTYWEGVDLPGVFLTSLLIIRLPFSPPGQPLVEARMEKLEAEGKDPFYDFSLPQAVLRFKQGYGRLIRTTEDWGVVVVLDNRIVNKRYGQVFQKSLPGGQCFSASPRLLAEKIQLWRTEKTGTGRPGKE